MIGYKNRMPVNTSNKSLHPIYSAIALFILIATGTIIYSNTFNSPFLFDDEFFIVNDHAIRMTELSWDSIKTAAFKGSPAHRYLPNISWAINYYFGQLNPFGYHLVNLVIHLLSGIFLFLFIKNTLRVYPRDTRDIHPEIIAFFAALIWIAQPVGTQAVTYICQRMASMVALFYILSLFFYVRGRMAMRQVPSDWLKPGLYFFGCLFSAVCAIATKENAGTLPLVILLYEWFFFQDLKLDWSRRQILWIVFFVIVFAGVVFWFLGENPMFRIMNSYSRRDFSLIERVMTEWRIIIYYISLFVWAPPDRLNLDHDFPLCLSPVNPPPTIIALAAILGLFALAAYCAKKDRLIAFCILWFFITQATESTVIGIELIFEHRTYIPFMMTSLLFALMAFRLIRNRPLAYGLLVATTLVFCLWTYQRNQTWQNPISFLTDCTAKSPNKYRPQYNLGVALYDADDISGAIAQYEKTLKIDPNHADVYNNLGNALFKQGKIDEAIQYFRRSLALNPNFADAYNNLGNVLFKQGKIDEAIQYFRRALALNPDLADANKNLGNALFKQGKTDEAIKCFRRALALNPDHTEAHNNLANTLMQNGDIQGAIEHFQTILEQYPDHVEANINMGTALARLGQVDAAIRHYQTALKSDPYNPEAHNNVGVLFVQKKIFPEAVEHFKRALALRPGYASAINNLRRLEMMQK
jgi:protein O-mannosyl-transferase